MRSAFRGLTAESIHRNPPVLCIGTAVTVWQYTGPANARLKQF
jgi:hypothetical protein